MILSKTEETHITREKKRRILNLTGTILILLYVFRETIPPLLWLQVLAIIMSVGSLIVFIWALHKDCDAIQEHNGVPEDKSCDNSQW